MCNALILSSPTLLHTCSYGWEEKTELGGGGESTVCGSCRHNISSKSPLTTNTVTKHWLHLPYPDNEKTQLACPLERYIPFVHLRIKKPRKEGRTGIKATEHNYGKVQYMSGLKIIKAFKAESSHWG